jgi:hypothetical protein
LKVEDKVTLSVLITGLPANCIQPSPRPGESLFQLIIRNNQDEWRNYLHLLLQEHGLPDRSRERFLQGAFTAEDSKWASLIERFMNSHLPTAWRTLEAVAELREELASQPVQLVQILWLRTENAAGGDKAQVAARRFNAEMITLPRSAILDMEGPYAFLPKVISRIQGAFLWIVPGGTRFIPPMTAVGIRNVLDGFSKRPKLAMFVDELYTIVIRTQALRTAIQRGTLWPNDIKEQVKTFLKSDYDVWIQRMPLAELEPAYGGEPSITEAILKELRQLASGGYPVSEDSREKHRSSERPWWKLW